MKKQATDFNKGLSIQELEERHELTVAIPADAMEAAKDDDGDEEEVCPTDLCKCG